MIDFSQKRNYTYVIKSAGAGIKKETITMKRIIALLAAVLMVGALLLSGCGANDQEGTFQEATITDQNATNVN